jgi:hypothetical protein
LPYGPTEARFSERKGNPPCRTGLLPDKAQALLSTIVDRSGVRATSRLVGVHRDTAARYGRRLGECTQRLHGDLVAFRGAKPKDFTGRITTDRPKLFFGSHGHRV